MRVAIVHDWLTGMRGGERCLEAFCEVFPEADLYTLLHVKRSVSPAIERHRIATTFVQSLPGAARRYRGYLPLFPWAASGWDLLDYDVVLSSSHCVAKAARARPGRHLGYCYTPMRYAWDGFDDYFPSGPARLAAAPVMAWLRHWDRATASRVDRFVAISRCVASRIRNHYGREAAVIYPPVNLAAFRVQESPGDYDLVVSALVPYKRVDLAVEAATRLGRRLVVVGTGPEMPGLKRLAGPSVEFAGWQDDAKLAGWYAGCRALWFPGLEDFGIVPLEAMASGRPVLAYAAGGALETVVGLDDPEGRAPTGVLFAEQSAEGLIGAVRRLEAEGSGIRPADCRARAGAFDLPRFRNEIRAAVEAMAAQGRAAP